MPFQLECQWAVFRLWHPPTRWHHFSNQFRLGGEDLRLHKSVERAEPSKRAQNGCGPAEQRQCQSPKWMQKETKKRKNELERELSSASKRKWTWNEPSNAKMKKKKSIENNLNHATVGDLEI